ncbi:hypothetical protein ACJRO7_027646 [Eucalyptus globulus]|uniref:Uncharacterized protein n=1 Tax=Eucalyptus globulus TaxID=34317 RepID=A0ABD3JVM4_EUCGL
MLHSLCIPAIPAFSASCSKTIKACTKASSPYQPLYLRFRTSHVENVRYLRTLGVIDPVSKHRKLPSPDTIDRVLNIVNFLKSKGFSESDFPRLAYLCPGLFASELDPTDIAPVFEFLTVEVSASAQESCSLINKCPQILFSDVEYCLKPTLNYLRQLGIGRLNFPKLHGKVKFLRSIGLTHQEIARICARLPSIFGYSIDNNLRPKYDYLKRIAPRHLHLKRRNVKIPLNRMLLWGDEKFYAKWK